MLGCLATTIETTSLGLVKHGLIKGITCHAPNIRVVFVTDLDASLAYNTEYLIQQYAAINSGVTVETVVC